MSLTYDQYFAEMASLAQFNPSDPFFVQQLPMAIDYATQRISREINLLNAVTTTGSASPALTAGTRSLDFTAQGINILYQVNIITPFATTNPDLGTRNPLTVCDRTYLDMVYGSSSVVGQPMNFALLNNTTLLFGPFPDQNYTVELVGTIYPAVLSAGTPTTFVSTYLDDVLIAASMVFMAGAMKNFGAQSDNPAQGATWETQYQTLMGSAQAEDARRKFMSVGYISSQLPMKQNPPRT